MLRYAFLRSYCLFLVAVQVVTALALVFQVQGGRFPEGMMPGMFIGLNLPILLAHAFQRRSGVNLGSINFRAGCLAMGLIGANFLRAGLMVAVFSNGMQTWTSMLHILTAQSLWLAIPAAWVAGRPANR